MNGDEAAFPCTISVGMTKRELLAAMALQGLCSDYSRITGSMRDGCHALIVEQARKLADKQIEELSKEPNP